SRSAGRVRTSPARSRMTNSTLRPLGAHADQFRCGPAGHIGAGASDEPEAPRPDGAPQHCGRSKPLWNAQAGKATVARPPPEWMPRSIRIAFDYALCVAHRDVDPDWGSPLAAWT